MKYDFVINVESTIKERCDLDNMDIPTVHQLKFDLNFIKLNDVEFVSIDEWITENHLNDDDASDFKENVEECLEDWTYKTVYYENCEISTDKYEIDDQLWFFIKKGNKFYAISHDYWDIMDIKVKKVKSE